MSNWWPVRNLKTYLLSSDSNWVEAACGSAIFCGWLAWENGWELWWLRGIGEHSDNGGRSSYIYGIFNTVSCHLQIFTISPTSVPPHIILHLSENQAAASVPIHYFLLGANLRDGRKSILHGNGPDYKRVWRASPLLGARGFPSGVTICSLFISPKNKLRINWVELWIARSRCPTNGVRRRSCHERFSTANTD